MAFNNTITQTFDLFCPNGTCIQQAEQAGMALEQQYNVTQNVDMILQDEDIKGVVSATLGDLSSAFGFDTSVADAFLQAEDTEEIAQMGQAAAAEV